MVTPAPTRPSAMRHGERALSTGSGGPVSSATKTGRQGVGGGKGGHRPAHGAAHEPGPTFVKRLHQALGSRCSLAAVLYTTTRARWSEGSRASTPRPVSPPRQQLWVQLAGSVRRFRRRAAGCRHWRHPGVDMGLSRAPPEPRSARRGVEQCYRRSPLADGAPSLTTRPASREADVAASGAPTPMQGASPSC